MGHTPVMEMLARRVAATMRAHPSWRYGQTWFNVVHGMYPEIAEKVRASALDPFYVDALVPVFLDFVEGEFVP